ncbi:hypothetical protein LPJ61_001183 [Coemansia biformis]|uniref:Major facilitator superfamily (MFS) profile domain-containing protein n=1 Tax=Coemansia biformis TaxID=1286918 RepID=A0A9W7YEV0_9FUNG|nr:hypothetical protein LPJ61_001183 [Coemansia biformis]
MSSLSLFIDTFVYSLTVAMLPEILQGDMRAPESANGLVTTVFGLGSIVGGLAAGCLSDYFQNRRIFQVLASLVYIVAGSIFYVVGHFYQILLFRAINGIASGIACALAFSSMGDVYPANLLGFKTAIVYLCNDIAYTIGPICGQRLYHIAGVRGPAAVAIALSIFRFAVYLVIAEDSLAIRGMQTSAPAPACDADTAADSLESSASLEHQCKGQEHAQSAYHNVSEDGAVMQAAGGARPGKDVPMLRLLMSLPVIVATLSIATSLGVQSMLEALVPLHLIDSLHHPDDGGITFVILGLTFTALVSAVGKVNDMLIERRGEVMRYYIMLFGAAVMVLAAVLMSLAKTYAVLMVGFSLFALANLCMVVPALSAYGDFVNDANANSMARGYAIAGCAWAAGVSVMPTVGSALYSRLGFSAPVISATLVLCTASTVGFVVFIVRDWHMRKRRHNTAHPRRRVAPV